jgi:hypothetical protein
MAPVKRKTAAEPTFSRLFPDNWAEEPSEDDSDYICDPRREDSGSDSNSGYDSDARSTASGDAELLAEVRMCDILFGSACAAESRADPRAAKIRAAVALSTGDKCVFSCIAYAIC